MRRRFLRTLLFARIGLALLATIAVIVSRAAAVPVQVVVATASEGTTATGVRTGGGATTVTANGYGVARTRASVSANIAGQPAQLDVSAASFVREGMIIDNDPRILPEMGARVDTSSSPRDQRTSRPRKRL